MTRKKRTRTKINTTIPYTLEDWLKIHYPDIFDEYEQLVEII